MCLGLYIKKKFENNRNPYFVLRKITFSMHQLGSKFYKKVLIKFFIGGRFLVKNYSFTQGNKKMHTQFNTNRSKSKHS